MRITTVLGFLLLASSPLHAQGRRGPDNAPAEGTKIPQVEARTKDGKQTVKLSEPKRLTVLVFGSHT